MSPNDLVTELQTGERDLAIDGPDPKDFDDREYDEWKDEQTIDELLG